MRLRPAPPLRVPYAGARAAEGPLTLGQRNILQWVPDVDDPVTVYLPRIVELPGTVSVAEVAGALSTLLARHEGLRTTFQVGAAARQRVAAAGELVVAVYTAGAPESGPPPGPRAGGLADGLAAEVTRSLRENPPDPLTEPVRVAMVVAEDRALVVALVCSHLVVDQYAMALLAEELPHLVSRSESHKAEPSVPQSPGLQPLDLAAEEHQPRLRRRAEEALSYWRSQLWRMPASLCAVPYPDGPVEPGTGYLSSPAAAEALARIADRARVSPASAVLAAVCAVLAQRGGHEECVLPILSGNRFERVLTGYVGSLVQTAVVTVAVAGVGFDALARRAWLATVQANSHGRYDINQRVELAERIGYERGVHLSFEPAFNNQSVTRAAPAAPIPAGLRWEPSAFPTAPPPRFDLFGVDGAMILAGTATGCGLGRSEVEELLLAVERLLVAAGPEDLAPWQVSEAVGLPPQPRGPEWRLLNADWVYLPAVQQLVEEAVAPSVVQVGMADVRDGHADTHAAGRALVAFLTADGPARTPVEAHLRCLAALPGQPAVMTPSHYVICGRAPGDPADLSTWQRQPVAAAGSGRLPVDQLDDVPVAPAATGV